jgi:ATP-dependent Clp protease protease subunit
MEVPVSPTRVWMDPHADWRNQLYGRLLERRIVLATGILDDDAASRLSAQLLTLDAEGKDPVRLELQNMQAELTAALTVMGILDVMRAPVQACVSGEISGPALGVLVSCPRRSAYPNASFVLREPKLAFGGTVTALSTHEQHVTRMLDTLYFKLAEVTGREVDEIRDDARRGRSLTTAQAIGYGLVQVQETSAHPAEAPGSANRPSPADQPSSPDQPLQPRVRSRGGHAGAVLTSHSVLNPIGRDIPPCVQKIALCTHSLAIGNIISRAHV